MHNITCSLPSNPQTPEMWVESNAALPERRQSKAERKREKVPARQFVKCCVLLFFSLSRSKIVCSKSCRGNCIRTSVLFTLLVDGSVDSSLSVNTDRMVAEPCEAKGVVQNDVGLL